MTLLSEMSFDNFRQQVNRRHDNLTVWMSKNQLRKITKDFHL